MVHDDQEISEDEVIDDVLGENPRASQLRLFRAALEERRKAFKADIERSTDDSDKSRLRNKLKVLNKQIEALRQEEGIAEFVENSVRVTLRTASIDDEEEEEPSRPRIPSANRSL